MRGIRSLTCANGLSVVSCPCRLMKPEVPEKSQRALTPGGQPFSSVRHYQLDGPPEVHEGAGTSVPGDRCPVNALRDRQVLMIDDGSSAADGREPAVLATVEAPYVERPVARARQGRAHELIVRLVAVGRVRERPHFNARSQRPQEGRALVPAPSRLGHRRSMVTSLEAHGWKGLCVTLHGPSAVCVAGRGTKALCLNFVAVVRVMSRR